LREHTALVPASMAIKDYAAPEVERKLTHCWRLALTGSRRALTLVTFGRPASSWRSSRELTPLRKANLLPEGGRPSFLSVDALDRPSHVEFPGLLYQTCGILGLRLP
jgi:hypothetical protein